MSAAEYLFHESNPFHSHIERDRSNCLKALLRFLIEVLSCSTVPFTEENFSIVPLSIVNATNVIQAEIAFVNSAKIAIVAAKIVEQID